MSKVKTSSGIDEIRGKTYTSVRAWKYNSLIYEYKQSHPFEQ